MRIKNIDLENFKPLVCVPIVDSRIEDGIETAKSLVSDNVEVIEWRLDFLRELSDIDALLEGLNKMSKICKDTILVGTIRSIEEGGKSELKENDVTNYLYKIAETRTCDFIDMEYYTYDRPENVISKLKEMGQKVICSHHDFDETPDDEVIFTLLEEMESSECDIVKMAVMPRTTTDVTRFMDICNSFSLETDKLTITMSMGNLGKASRFAGNVTGSCITFGSFNESSAPGQIDYKRLKEIIN